MLVIKSVFMLQIICGTFITVDKENAEEKVKMDAHTFVVGDQLDTLLNSL